jgi:hypothetical protein
MAFTFGLTRSICERKAIITSVADSARLRISRASSTASLKHITLLALIRIEVSEEQEARKLSGVVVRIDHRLKGNPDGIADRSTRFPL